ncbi:predicted protein [Uncinocarpus reesii 1704]|uniref:SGNH hydrolase-type esterase domain-containing protein n=1 Tax=Uncinocarpus reesii (strain UAMH 1704) TaxID=336963 RepID=C4JSE5_UNCRE|nr:uncharacterized protein UREG_05384 [Uncinocarpus reesii 1704]EEP80542.1 predicted protein [Uncinocarpus reesii 1704]
MGFPIETSLLSASLLQLDSRMFPLNAALDVDNRNHSTENHPQIAPKIPLVIKSFAALGDSYASGVGAGKQLDETCWRYSGSYPVQLNNSGIFGGHTLSMQFLACTGAVMKKDWGVTTFSGSSKTMHIWDQINALRDADFVTLSIGGNDIGFFDLLNACLFQFYGPASPNCETVKKVARARILSREFWQTYSLVLDAILRKNPARSFRIFANGYGKFFDTALTEECNTKSLGYWLGYQPKLTVKTRRELNEISTMLNDRIGQIISWKKNERVILVNWDPRFDSHRFCRPRKGLTDPDTWFFDSRFRLRGGDPIDPETCKEDSKVAVGDWDAQARCAIAITHANYPKLRPILRRPIGKIDPFGPENGRLFHPKPEGYKAMVDQILQVWPYTVAETKVEADNARLDK